MSFARINGESTSQWLERLIGIDAPEDIRANVQQILANEVKQAKATSSNGK